MPAAMPAPPPASAARAPAAKPSPSPTASATPASPQRPSDGSTGDTKGDAAPSSGATTLPVSPKFDIDSELGKYITKPDAPTEVKPIEPQDPDPAATTPAPQEGKQQSVTKGDIDPVTGLEKKSAVTPAPTFDGSKAGIKQLREVYESSQKKISELEKRIEEMGKASPPPDPEKDEIKTKLTKAEQRAKELDDEIRFVDYTKSSEYQEKYEKPIKDAFGSAYADVSELIVKNPDGTQRIGTADDFNALLRMPLLDAASRVKEMFGDASGEVMAHRRKILELGKNQNEALKQFREQGTERAKQTAEKQKTDNQAIVKIYTETGEDIKKQLPHYFAPDDKDPEASKLLEDGYKLADVAFGADSNITPDQLARVHAVVRMRSAAFGRVAHQLTKSQERITALEKELEEFRASGPGAPTANKEKPSNANWEFESAIREFTKK